MAKFEIRIPTYRRPAMLERALRNVIAQTESDWEVFISDDSPDREGEAVVASLRDPRIHYHCNGTNLGAARNCDQMFRKQPHSDAHYFTILSDDNLMSPHFLKRGRDLVERTDCQIVLMNETVVDENGTPFPDGRTTRGGCFEPGVVNPVTLYATLFLIEGISDGGLFWTRNARSNLEVGPDMQEVCLQEVCRSLKVVEPMWFEPEPCAGFSLLPKDLVVRQTRGNRIVGRGSAEISRYLINRGGQAIIEKALVFAKRINRLEELKRSVELAFLPWERGGIGARNWKLRCKSLVRSCITRNPVAGFLAQRPGAF